MTVWASDYIGLPFLDGGRGKNGVDCWGLVRMVLDDRANVDLPFYDGIAAMDGATVRDVVRQQAQSSDWIEVNRLNARELDVVLMRGRVDAGGLVRAAETHVGVMVGDKQVLHVEPGINSVLEKITSPRVARRISRVFRHEALA